MLRYFESEMVDAILLRSGSGSWIDFKWVPAGDLPTPIRIIAVQPVQANDMQLLPQGEPVRDYVRTYAPADLDIMPRQGDIEPDRIQVDGKTYKVMTVDRRRPLGNYHKIVMRDEGGV
jgi:hypothetical protein